MRFANAIVSALKFVFIVARGAGDPAHAAVAGVRASARSPAHGGARSRSHADLFGVSVVVPAYNEELGIEAAVESLVASDYPVLEVIVVDDGSTDATASRVAALDLPNVRLIRQAERRQARSAEHRRLRGAARHPRPRRRRHRLRTLGHAGPGGAVHGSRGRCGLGQHQGGQQARSSGAVAAHRVRHRVQPRSTHVRRPALHAHGPGGDRCLPTRDPGVGRRGQRRHPRRGHGPDDGDLSRGLACRLRPRGTSVDGSARESRTAVAPALSLVLRDDASHVEAPGCCARVRSRGQARSAWAALPARLPGPAALARTTHRRRGALLDHLRPLADHRLCLAGVPGHAARRRGVRLPARR